MLNQSSFGNKFKVTTWGESHGPALGCVIDGCPSGLPLTVEMIQAFLDRRKPGQSRFTTTRKEADQAQILSGVFEGKTTGTPICIAVFNTDQRSRDYSNIAETYRPGHADYTFDQKFGFRDYRGGGRSSGRETIGRVAAGAVASAILGELGISITAYTRSIGPVEIAFFDPAEIAQNPVYMPDAKAAVKAQAYLDQCIAAQDSSGGVIECLVQGMPAGVGDPVFGKLDAALTAALMSIGAVKAVEIGDGVAVGQAKGSANNDAFISVPNESKNRIVSGTQTAPEGQNDQSLLKNDEKSRERLQRLTQYYDIVKTNDMTFNDIPKTNYVNSNVICNDHDVDNSSCNSRIAKKSNHSGGILGGISDGDTIILRAHVKPTPSISQPQQTVRKNGEQTILEIHGRHDPVIVPRAVVVVESMTAITLVDALFSNMSARMDRIREFYQR